MKRLLTVALAALLCVSGSSRAEGPDDAYIAVYNLIQEADRYAETGQTEFARQRYSAALAALNELKSSYPQWNEKLVSFRLRTLESKLDAITPKPSPGPASSAPPVQAEAPAPAPAPAPSSSSLAPVTAAPISPQAQVENASRENLIRELQAQVGRLRNDNAVLESKLREALAARPAALDPRELTRAEQRIRSLEKEREVLNVSLAAAETKAAQRDAAGNADLTRALNEARRKVAEQNDAILALRQEKDVLQMRLQSAARSDEETMRSLRAENDRLRKELADRSSAPQPGRSSEALANELASTKAALQSSRDSLASLQVRVRTLQEERDQLDKTRQQLEAKLASGAQVASADSTQVRRLQQERDLLQKRLDDATRQLGDGRSAGAQAQILQKALNDVSGLRARLDVLEARKVPYTPEELALFKKPGEPAVLTAAPAAVEPSEPPPASAGPLMAEAQRAFAARRFDEAERKYQEILQIDDKNVGTLQRLAAIQLEQSRPKDAEATLRRALDQNPKDARTLLLLGIAKFDQDNFDEAFDSLSRSAQLDPQNAETQNYLGITLSQKGQRAAAETALRKAIQLSPNYASAHYNLAVVYATQQPPFTELARWHYQKALAFGHPQNPDLEKLLDHKQASSQN